MSLDYTRKAFQQGPLHLSVQQKLCKEDFEAVVLWRCMPKSQSGTSSDWERQKATLILGCHHKLHSCPYYNQNEAWVGRGISEINSTSISFQSPLLKMGLQTVLPLGSAHSDPSESIVTSSSGPTVVKYLQNNSIEENLSWKGGGFSASQEICHILWGPRVYLNSDSDTQLHGTILFFFTLSIFWILNWVKCFGRLLYFQIVSLC